MRLYALLALKRVWSLAEERAAEGVDGFAGLSTVVKACLNQAEAMQSTGWEESRAATTNVKKLVICIIYLLEFVFAVSLFRNANKNWMRIQEHFFFGAFHPIRDYSVEVR